MVTVKENALPTVAVAEEAEVIVSASFTVRVKAWLADPAVFVAPIVIG